MQAVEVQSLVGGAKIPHDSWPKNQNIKHRNIVITNSIKALKMSHIKNLFLKNETGGSWWRMKEQISSISDTGSMVPGRESLPVFDEMRILWLLVSA